MKRIASFVALIFAFAGVGLTPAIAVEERLIDIVSVNWAGSAQPPATVDQLATLVNTEVNAGWKRFTTFVGDTNDRTISFVAGKVLTDPIFLSAKMACTGAASTDFINQIRREAYKRLAVSDTGSRYLIISAPKAGCVWSGRAQVGNALEHSGTLVLHDSKDSFVIIHELGHSFGLGHTNFLRCSDGKPDGAWGEICKAVEYGGTIDVMGNVETNSPLNTYHQWRMGLLDSSQIKQVWGSETLTLVPSDFAKGIRAIYMRDGKSAYWIEYRRTLEGVGYKPGLVIFRLDPPPISLIVSPNPEDSAAAEFGDGLGSDVWMLNLDTYRYVNSLSVGGSMSALTATTYSGNISLSAVASESGAVITVKRKGDRTTPSVPVLTPSTQWRSPGVEIIKPDYADADIAIASFQASINGVVSDLPVSQVESWSPTYLNPFTAPKTLHLRDLPEGTYSLALRAIDIVGNKSEWSSATQVTIDRGPPVATNDFLVTSVNENQISVAWSGAKDSGSGLCQMKLVNEEGLVLQSSATKTAPVIQLTNGVALNAKAQLFDCVGNGITGDLSLTNTFQPADKSSRTGKWSAAGALYNSGALKCVGKCTASLSVSGRFDVMVGTGASVVTLGAQTLATIPDSKSSKLRVGASVESGKSRRVVRISGSNFVLIGINSLVANVGEIKTLDRLPPTSDPSLVDPKQATLAKYGFNSDDFSQEWTVLPMGGGTTINDPSLDLCNGTYPSEKERVERRQVIATKVGSNFSFLSTETVRYASTAAAVKAQSELVKTMAQCTLDKGFKDKTGTYVPYIFTEMKNLPGGLVSEGSRLLVRTQIGTGANMRQLLGFYQFSGEILTGLYVMSTSQTGFSDAQVATWLHVAATMAQRLNGKSS